MAQRDYMRIGAGQSPVAGDDVPVTIVVNPDGTNVGGGGGGSSGGSVTAPGTAGTQAQTIQGNAAGVPVPVSTPKKPIRAQGSKATSATASTAGAPQSTQVLPADAGRTKFRIQNLGTAPIYLRTNESGENVTATIATGTDTAPLTADMVAIPGGQLYVTEPEETPAGPIYVASGTASVPYSYRAW